MPLDITSSEITASGNISASGYIHANHFKAGSENAYYILGTRALYADTGKLYIGNSGAWTANTTVVAGLGIELDGPVTASSHISSSGTVSANNFLLNGVAVGTSTDTFWISGSGGAINYTAGTVGVEAFSAGAITATTIDTGQGASEIYQMSQNVRTTDNVTFAQGTFNGQLKSLSNVTASVVQAPAAAFDTLTLGGQSNFVFHADGPVAGEIPMFSDTNGTLEGQEGFTLTNGSSKLMFKPQGYSTGLFVADAQGQFIKFGANVRVTGSLNVSGSITVTGSLNVSGSITAEDVVVADDLTVGDNIIMSDGGMIMDAAGNNDEIFFDSTNRQIRTRIDNDNILTVANGQVAINTNTPIVGAALTIVGNVSASGTIAGSNLSGSNTGDQDLSNLAVVETSVIFNNVIATGFVQATGTIAGSNLSGSNTGDQDLSTFVTNSQTGSYAVTGTNVVFNHITASGNVSGSLISTASFGVYIGDGSQLTGVASSGGTIDTGSFAITGSDVIFDDLTTTGQIIAGDNISTSANINASGNITASGNIVAHGNITASGHITAGTFISASGAVHAERLIVNGTGVPTIFSPTNIILSASNAVVIADSPLRLKGYINSQTGSAANAPGDIYFNTNTNKFMGFNGSTHVELG